MRWSRQIVSLAVAGGRAGAALHAWRRPPRRAGVTATCTQLRSSGRPASPDFSGWNWVAHSGPFSTAATNRAPCSAQVTLGATAAKAPSGLEVPALRRRRSGRSRTARAPRRRTAASPPGRSTSDQPMCGTTVGRQPVDGAGPLPEPGLGPVDAGLGRAVEQHLHADADARAPAGRRPAAARSAGARRPRAAPRMQAWKLPTPGTNSPSAASTAAGSAVSSTSAPTRSSMRTAECTLPLP